MTGGGTSGTVTLNVDASQQTQQVKLLPETQAVTLVLV